MTLFPSSNEFKYLFPANLTVALYPTNFTLLATRSPVFLLNNIKESFSSFLNDIKLSLNPTLTLYFGTRNSLRVLVSTIPCEDLPVFGQL